MSDRAYHPQLPTKADENDLSDMAEKPTCMNCIHSVWVAGASHGLKCAHSDNTSRGLVAIPTRSYFCEKHQMQCQGH